MMGVINLTILVNKIRKKLGFASATKAGLVKVGDGLDISESGVLSATGGSGGGITLTEIASDFGNFTFPTGKTISDYTLLLVVGKRPEYDIYTTTIIPVSLLSSTSNKFPLVYNDTLLNDFVCTTTGTTNNQSGSINIVKVYAI